MTTYATRCDDGPNRGYYSVGGVLLPSVSLLLAPYKKLDDWELHPKYASR